MLALIAVGWAGLLRMGFQWPVLQPTLPMAHGPLMVDGFLGAVIGFVISMIFGHAPIIFPAMLGVGFSFHRFFYTHLGLLHISLVIRVAGDLAGWGLGREWGGFLNAIAILLFIFNTVLAVILEGKK